jgi:hypothetical protein
MRGAISVGLLADVILDASGPSCCRAAEQRDELTSPYVEHGLPILEPVGPANRRRAKRRRARHAGGGGGGGGFGGLGGGGFGGLDVGNPHLIHSITSSARISSEAGKKIPRVLAVFRFKTRSNLVGCWIGRSPGFSPFNTRPA